MCFNLYGEFVVSGDYLTYIYPCVKLDRVKVRINALPVPASILIRCSGLGIKIETFKGGDN